MTTCKKYAYCSPLGRLVGPLHLYLVGDLQQDWNNHMGFPRMCWVPPPTQPQACYTGCTVHSATCRTLLSLLVGGNRFPVRPPLYCITAFRLSFGCKMCAPLAPFTALYVRKLRGKKKKASLSWPGLAYSCMALSINTAILCLTQPLHFIVEYL